MFLLPMKKNSFKRPALRRAVFAVTLLLAFTSGVFSQRRPARPVPATALPVVAATTQDFAALQASAASAREGERVEEAIGLYQQALRLKPNWAEGQPNGDQLLSSLLTQL